MDADTIYIRDDNGHAWHYKDGAIRMVLAELEGVAYDQNGYPCGSLEDGVKLLNQYGYITGEDDDSKPIRKGPPQGMRNIID